MNNKDKILIKQLNGVEIEKIVESYSESKWSQGGIAESRYKYSKDLKKSTDLRDASSTTPCLILQNFVTKEVEPILSEYSKTYDIDFYKTEYQLVRYKEGQFFKEHTDATDEFPRKISILIYLNSNYSGGEIVFTKLSMPIKPEKNTLIMFPSSEEFSHSAEPIKSGTKYVIVGFAS
jgi:Rps23 Pro-64 3,4-dihydroxylase Tpa1-like proline 4-hydroxylase